MKRTIVNICCLGHSGSTLLGNILGSHSSGLHIGELVAPLKKGKPIVCRNCLDQPCPIWGKVITPKYMRKVYNDFTTPSSFSFIRNYKSKLYHKLFKAFNNVDFIVDSSKNVNWYKYNSQNESLNYKFIFLKRTPAAIVASLKRGYNEDVEVSMTKIRDIQIHINSYFKEIPVQNKLVVEYEDLILYPEKVILRICDFLSLEYEADVLKINQFDHHLIGGNQGMLIQKNHNIIREVDQLIDVKTPGSTVDYYKSLNGLRLDLRWEQELSQREKKVIERSSNHFFVY